MNCSRCGNPIDPNSSFCNTCGNAIVKPTVIPQVNNTVVPQVDNTVVPTVVPKKNNNTPIVAIILVLIVFIGAGSAGVILLKQTKSNITKSEVNQNIVYNEKTTTSKTQGGFKNTTTKQSRLDVVDENNYYKVKGLTIVVPAGFTHTYSDNILTVVNPNTSKSYMISVVDRSLDLLDLNEYKKGLAQKGYNVDVFTKTKIGEFDAIAFNITSSVGTFSSYLVKAEYNKIAVFMFLNEDNTDYISNIILTSLGK